MIRRIDLLLSLMLVATSSAGWLSNNPTAFEWPAIDMTTFFERFYDPGFLTNDFLTNASTTPNPRFIFAYIIIAIAGLLGSQWYNAYFLLKTIFVILMPIVIYFALVSLIVRTSKVKNSTAVKFVIAAGVFLAVNDKLPFIEVDGIYSIRALFSVAWWQPYYTFVAPQTFSIFLGFLGIIVKTRSGRVYTNPANALWFLSSLIHPANGLGIILFYYLTKLPIEGFKKSGFMEALITLLVSWVFPCVILILSFSPEISLSSAQFTEIYAFQGHQSHYVLSAFGSFSKYSWWVSFLFVCSLFIINMISAGLMKNKDILYLGAIYLSTYISFIAIQYIGVESFPIKQVAALGPSRLTALGYWEVLVISSLNITIFTSSRQVKEKRGPIFTRLNKPVHSCSAIAAVVVLLTGITWSYEAIKDDPFSSRIKNEETLYNWIQNETAKTDTFIVPAGNLTQFIPYIAHRPIYAGTNFPFSEDYFLEYYHRDSFAYGTYKERTALGGSWVGSATADHYRALNPKNFVRESMTRQIDYVIIEKEYSGLFREFSPAFSSDNYLIYKISSLMSSA